MNTQPSLNGEPQNGGNKKTKQAKFSEKRTFLPPDTHTYVQKCSFFQRIWRALFSCYLRFEILRPFANTDEFMTKGNFSCIILVVTPSFQKYQHCKNKSQCVLLPRQKNIKNIQDFQDFPCIFTFILLL